MNQDQTNSKEESTTKQDQHECCGGGCCSDDHQHSHASAHQLEEIAYNNHVLLQSLITLLVKKNIITETDFQQQIDQLFKQKAPEEEPKQE
ncbi:MAG: hypothetical protein ACMXYF_04205 [Candidatus Woesearchaeota archaeon]